RGSAGRGGGDTRPHRARKNPGRRDARGRRDRPGGPDGALFARGRRPARGRPSPSAQRPPALGRRPDRRAARVPLGGAAGARGQACRHPARRAHQGAGRGRGARPRVRRELDVPSADRSRRGAGRGRPGDAEVRGDEPGPVRRTSCRVAAGGRPVLPRLWLLERRAHRGRRRADRGGVRRDAGAPARRAACVTDLALVGGRVLDPGQGIDSQLDIAVTAGRISAIGGAGRPLGPAGETIDASGLVLVPGLVDLPTHLYAGVSHYGIDPDANCLRRGVTTAVDAGSAGAQTFPGFRRYVIEPAGTRIFAFLHVAVQGMITSLVGELVDLRWASPDQAVARAREHPDLIVGVKVRLGYQMVGNDPGPALRLARRAAEQLGLPLMVHIIDMREPITWLLRHLGEGDIVTHCFHGNEGGILAPHRRLYPAAPRARAPRAAGGGVVVGAGHGAGSFASRVARAPSAQGSRPATVPSDLHAHNVGGPVYDQAPPLSKLLHWGMSLAGGVAATTAAPAAAIR